MPSSRDWIPLRTCSRPTSRCPPGAGPRGISRTQSSAKKDMIASTSCALNASRKPSSTEVAVLVLAMMRLLVRGSEPRAPTGVAQAVATPATAARCGAGHQPPPAGGRAVDDAQRRADGNLRVGLALVEPGDQRVDGRHVVLLRFALEMGDERAAPASVHEFDGDQAVHRRP